jgi:hypothetical protein
MRYFPEELPRRGRARSRGQGTFEVEIVQALHDREAI